MKAEHRDWAGAIRTRVSSEWEDGSYRFEGSDDSVRGHETAIERIEYNRAPSQLKKVVVLKAAITDAASGRWPSHVFIWSQDQWKPVAQISPGKLPDDSERAFAELYWLGFSIVAE